VKSKIKITLIIMVLIVIFCGFIYFINDNYISPSYSSTHYKKIDALIREYVKTKFGDEDKYIVDGNTHWNKHAFYMNKCVFYAVVKNVDSDFTFEILADNRKVISDTYNQRMWEIKLNDEYGNLVKEVFGNDATCIFTFTFDYLRSSQTIDDFLNITTFNSYLNRDIEKKNSNHELYLGIAPYKNFDSNLSLTEIDKILNYLKDSGINYGKVTFNFNDASKTYFYENIVEP